MKKVALFFFVMRIDIITIFPEIFDFYLQQSLLGKAQKRGAFEIKIHNLRDFAEDKHKTVDDKPFGGGRGMVLRIEPLYRAIKELNSLQTKTKSTRSLTPCKQTKIILFSPRGKKFNQRMATKWSKLSRLILICGRYEAVDERVDKLADEKVSLGDFVLMGGELPALAVIESIARLLPGVVGKSESLIGDRITKTGGFIEYPQYTRPEVFTTKDSKKLKVPKVLLSGHHKKIAQWRKKHSKIIE
ncbi:MAG: tRNA (guanosine(37)-N1)-methyltransferase TrmD [Patescibacteria group bacterium]|nr:tRNA (guanosine(37)-N1)-methyltransferase TrmD [Patescibacteria group bacterium]